MDPLIANDRDFLMDEKIRLEAENAKLRELVGDCLAKINHTLERGRLRERLNSI